MLLPSSIHRAEALVGIAIPIAGLACARAALLETSADRPMSASATNVVFSLNMPHISIGKVHRTPGSAVQRSGLLKTRHNLRQRRARAILARPGGSSNMDEAGELFVRLQSKPIENVAIERKPACQPTGAVTERGGRRYDVHGTRARRQLLFPCRHLGMRPDEADHGDDERGVGQPLLLDLDIGSGGLRVFPRKYLCDDFAGTQACIALEHDESPR